MLPRRWLWILLAVVGLAATIHAWMPERPRPCRATFERVHTGMTREEVEATVGGPPGRYDDRKSVWVGQAQRLGFFYAHNWWLGPDAGLMVRFDADGRADDVVIVNVGKLLLPTLWERFCQRLGV